MIELVVSATQKQYELTVVIASKPLGIVELEEKSGGPMFSTVLNIHSSVDASAVRRDKG